MRLERVGQMEFRSAKLRFNRTAGLDAACKD